MCCPTRNQIWGSDARTCGFRLLKDASNKIKPEIQCNDGTYCDDHFAVPCCHNAEQALQEVGEIEPEEKANNIEEIRSRAK
jgi:hypothetical protein